jgi:hypothetical protein
MYTKDDSRNDSYWVRVVWNLCTPESWVHFITLQTVHDSPLTFDFSYVHFPLASDRYMTERLTNIVPRQCQCKQRSNHGQKAQHGDKRGSHHIIVCWQRLRDTTLQHKSDKFYSVLRGITINRSPLFLAHSDNICLPSFSTPHLTTYYLFAYVCYRLLQFSKQNISIYYGLPWVWLRVSSLSKQNATRIFLYRILINWKQNQQLLPKRRSLSTTILYMTIVLRCTIVRMSNITMYFSLSLKHNLNLNIRI